MPFLELFAPSPVIAVLRAPDARRFVEAVEVLYFAGIRCVEFTLSTPGAIEAVRRVIDTLPEDLVVGVGAIRNAGDLGEAIDLGADFVVSPILRRDLLEEAERRRICFFPGALTPNEIVDAWECGVPAVKVFPIGSLGGLDYFDHLRAALPDVVLLPAGGIGVHEVGAYLERGAVAAGLSGHLLGDALLPSGDLDALAQRANEAVTAVARSDRN